MQAGSGLQKSDSEQRSDREIAASLLSNLRDTNDVPVENLDVKVEAGQALLCGEVEHEYQRKAVETVARRTKGVVAVDNRIDIKRSVSTAGVHRSIEEALFHVAEMDAATIKVTSNGSTVTLSGSVRSGHERSTAESAAWSVPGVKQVINRIRIGV